MQQMTRKDHFGLAPGSHITFFLDFLITFSKTEGREFNKTIIPFALVGYEIGYSQLWPYGPCWLFTISYPTRAHGNVNYLFNHMQQDFHAHS